MKSSIYHCYLLCILLTPLLAQGQWNSVSGAQVTSGKVGIGFTTPPTYDLDITRSTNPYIRIHNSTYTNNPSNLTRKGGVIFGQENSDKTAAILFAVPPGHHVPGILFATKVAYNDPGVSATDWYDRMFVHPGGNVGIGTTTNLDHKLTVAGPFSVFGPGLNGTTYQKFVLYSDATYGLLFEAPIKPDGAKLPITFGWRGGATALFVKPNGDVGIGTTSPDAKLTVAGNIHSREVKVTVNAGADYVFDADYSLRPLTEVEEFIKVKKHLPEVPSAKEMEDNGINLSEMNILLLKKVEELTLYVIELKKENEAIKKVLKKTGVMEE